MRGWSGPAICGDNAPIDDWGEGKCSDVPDVIEPRDVEIFDAGLFVCVVAVRSGNRPVIDVVSPCRRNAARNGILRAHPISRRAHLRVRAVRELALEVKSDIFTDAEATAQSTRGMHQSIARSWCPHREETGFRIKRAARIGGRRIVYHLKPRFKGSACNRSVCGEL